MTPARAREMLSSSPPPPPPPPKTGASGSDCYFFVVTVAVVAIVLVASNLVAFSFCSSCSAAQAVRRFAGIRRLPTGGGNRIPARIPSRKYRKEAAAADGDGDCSVCLSAFVDGEEVRQLPVCEHSFHAPCIDMWLYSHSSCPLCRAGIEPNPEPPMAVEVDAVILHIFA